MSLQQYIANLFRVISWKKSVSEKSKNFPGLNPKPLFRQVPVMAKKTVISSSVRLRRRTLNSDDAPHSRRKRDTQ